MCFELYINASMHVHGYVLMNTIYYFKGVQHCTCVIKGMVDLSVGVRDCRSRGRGLL